MSKKYESWVIQLLDDFWVSFYPGVPRMGNATESKCRTIEKEINKNISSSSLYNYFNEKSSPPTDGTKGIMSYYIIQQWKEQTPNKYTNIDIDDADLVIKKAPDKYLIMYRRLKATQQVNSPAIAPESLNDETVYEDINILATPQIKWLLVGCLSLIAALIIYLKNVTVVQDTTLTINEIQNAAASAKDLFLVSILHVCTVLLLLVIYYMPFGTKNQIKEVTDSYVRASLRQFEKGWIALWLSWIVLYSWMSFKWQYALNLLNDNRMADYLNFQQISWALSDVVNIVSTLCFFYLFFVMDIKTITTSVNEEATKQRFSRTVSLVIVVATLFLALTITDRYVDFGNWDGVGTWIYALFTSLAMLYFFGRLDSHYFKAHRVLLAPLYLYAVIQVNWDDLPFLKFASQGLVIFFIAFLLKIYLFFIINGWIRNGDFGRYFSQMRGLYGEE